MFGRNKTPPTDQQLFQNALSSGNDDEASALLAEKQVDTTPAAVESLLGKGRNLASTLIQAKMPKTLTVLFDKKLADPDEKNSIHLDHKLNYETFHGSLLELAEMLDDENLKMTRVLVKAGANPYLINLALGRPLSRTREKQKALEELLNSARAEFGAKHPEKADAACIGQMANAILDWTELARRYEPGDGYYQHMTANLEKTLCALAEGRNINARDNKTVNLLNHAIGHTRSVQIVSILVEKLGADVNLSHGECPLGAALSTQNNQIFDYLLYKGAKLDARDGGLEAPVERLFGMDNVALLSILRKHKFDFDALLPNGDTPLLSTLRRGQPKMAHALLQMGVDPTKPGAGGITPLEYVKNYCVPETIHMVQRACDEQAQRAMVQRIAQLEAEMKELKAQLLATNGPLGKVAAPAPSQNMG